jgi:hypothetical protein
MFGDDRKLLFSRTRPARAYRKSGVCGHLQIKIIRELQSNRLVPLTILALSTLVSVYKKDLGNA